MSRDFLKMNGLGNDFVVVAPGDAAFAPTRTMARAIADRSTGIGCDQLIGLETSRRADAFMRIWNADGGEVAACGNGARCVGWLLMEAKGGDAATIETATGVLHAWRADGDQVTIDMGPPGLDWRDIPLAWAMDTRTVQLRIDETLEMPGCVSMGNPHAVFFVSDAEAAAIDRLGPQIEHHWLFPERANVEFAQILDPAHIRLRVWERGVGITQACGTGACATLVAACRRGLTGRSATLHMDGGPLRVEWREADDHVLLTGPVVVDFVGRLPTLEFVA